MNELDVCNCRRPLPPAAATTEHLDTSVDPHTDSWMAAATWSAVRLAGTVASSVERSVRETETDVVPSVVAA